MKKKYTTYLLLFLFTLASFAQKAKLASSASYKMNWDGCVYKASDEVSTFKNLRSQIVKDRMEGRNNNSPCAEFIVSFDSNFDDQSREAFQFAADIWASLIDSPIPIRIFATFADAANPNNLGSARASEFSLLSVEGLPENTLYPSALAEQLLGEDSDGPNGQSFDIFANFNGGRSDWYFDIDPNGIGDNEFDFITVVLHEIGHGLGVLGFGRQAGFFGAIRQPVDLDNGTTIMASGIWDNFIEGENVFDDILPVLDDNPLNGFPDPSTRLLNVFQSETLAINAPAAVAENGGVPPRTYAPLVFDPGSSYSHLDFDTFTGTDNALMTPFALRRTVNRNPGPIILGFMEDMGWTLCSNALSTDDFALEDIAISPNPFTEAITINLPSNLRNDNFNISIIDLNGRVIINQDISASNGEITLPNLNSLKASLYFITVESLDSGASFTDKIIKR